MKSLMVAAVSALCCAAFAQCPDADDEPMGRASAESAMTPNGPRHGGMRNGGKGKRPGGMPGAGMADPVLRMVLNPEIAERLGLTDEQKGKLKEVMAGAGDKKESQKKVREATMKQVELMKAEKIDEAAVMATIDEVFELRKQMAKDQLKRLIAVKSILTPEQIAKAHEEMMSRAKGRGERGPRQGRRHKGEKNGSRGAPADGEAPAPGLRAE